MADTTDIGTDWLDRAASLQAQLNLVRKWRSWYANGEAPSPERVARTRPAPEHRGRVTGHATVHADASGLVLHPRRRPPRTMPSTTPLVEPNGTPPVEDRRRAMTAVMHAATTGTARALCGRRDGLVGTHSQLTCPDCRESLCAEPFNENADRLNEGDPNSTDVEQVGAR